MKNVSAKTFSALILAALTVSGTAEASTGYRLMKGSLMESFKRQPAQQFRTKHGNRRSAQVAGQSATNVVQTTAEPVKLPFSLTYSNEWYGPSVGRPERMQPDEYGQIDPDSFQSVDNTFSISTSLAENTALSGSFNFNMMPDRTDAKGGLLKLSDPMLKLKQGNIYKDANWSFGTDLRIYFPASDSSQDVDMTLNVRTTPSLKYQFSGSRWSMGLGGMLRTYFYSSVKEKQKAWAAYLLPNVGYKISPELSASISYEMDAKIMRGKNLSQWESAGTSLRTQLGWDATDYLSIAPFLQFHPGGKLNLDSTWLGANIDITFI